MLSFSGIGQCDIASTIGLGDCFHSLSLTLANVIGGSKRLWRLFEPLFRWDGTYDYLFGNKLHFLIKHHGKKSGISFCSAGTSSIDMV
jgi:hypothetical protein